MLSLRASVARGSDGAPSKSVRSRLQQRLAEANNFQKALVTSLLAWVALGVWSYLIVVPIPVSYTHLTLPTNREV